MDVRVRMGDAIDPFQLANGFEAVIGPRTFGGGITNVIEVSGLSIRVSPSHP